MPSTLLVPGALLPEQLALQIIAGLPDGAQDLALGLGAVQSATLETFESVPVHLQWLGRFFGLPAGPVTTAPFAFRGPKPPPPGGPTPWIAHATPVHLAVASDHVALLDLEDAPLTAQEEKDLLAVANATAFAAGLQFAVRNGSWFACSAQPWDLQAVPVAAVNGRAIQEFLPNGTDAKRWRVLSNEIQMAWHECPANLARDARGVPPVNGIWIHGGGTWSQLPAPPVAALRLPPSFHAADALRGWMASAQAAPAAAQPAEGWLAIHDGFQRAQARNDWGAWMAALPEFCSWLAKECALAADAGMPEVALVLTGTQCARTARLAVRSAWWRRLAGARRASPAALASLLAEPAPAAA